MPPFDALKYGTIGLCAILVFFSFQLLAREQKSAKPRREIINLIRTFMILTVVAMAIGLSSQLPFFHTPSANPASSVQWASGFGPEYFNANWGVHDAHDVSVPQFSFTPRYSYSGTLRGYVNGRNLTLTGDMSTNDIVQVTNELGKAKFTFEGPINNNEAAGHFTYQRTDVSGFGTAFIKFDSGGDATMYMIVRVTRTKEHEGDIAMVIIPLRRFPA